MSFALSPDTQAILLLTAPMIVGRNGPSAEVLTPAEYRRLARLLREKGRQPADLVRRDAETLVGECRTVVDRDRLRALLDRGFLLGQAVEHWQARAIWVASRADAAYPDAWKQRLDSEAPPVLYGCGNPALLRAGGLAVVGSRHADDGLIAYAEAIGKIAAGAGKTVVSGGARGIDQAAMRGALTAEGTAAGVIADSLERMALNREHRNLLMARRLVLVSPYDPASGFNVGHAMQRNKLIYALADAALVVSAEHEKGGTWAGAVEQLERFRSVPVYVRTGADTGPGLEALGRKGALPWPDPRTAEALTAVLGAAANVDREQRLFPVDSAPEAAYGGLHEAAAPVPSAAAHTDTPAASPADALFATVRMLLAGMDAGKTDAEVAAELDVSKSQAKAWLQRLVDEGVLERVARPTRYRARRRQRSLFDNPA
jgi:predicted Rossmann fold nucleotide-binding protein DprA/Smf involved in DNA uptake